VKFKRITTLAALLLFLFGCAADGDTRGLGQITKDMSITGGVNTQFTADNSISSFDIDVDTYDGIVTLTGTVPREVDISRSTKIVKSVRNVKQVINKLTVNKPTAN